MYTLAGMLLLLAYVAFILAAVPLTLYVIMPRAMRARRTHRPRYRRTR